MTADSRWPVLLLARGLDIGGSERQMTAVARALDRSMFDPHVGCFRPEGLRAQELRAAGIPIAHFPVYSFASFGAPRGAVQMARYVRRHRIRLIHAWDYPLTVFAVPVGRFLTSARVLSSQRSHRSLIPPPFHRLVRLTDGWVDSIVVNCEFVRRHLEQDEGVPRDRIELCYNGIDLIEFHPRDGERSAGPIVIGTLCGLRPEKDLATLIDAFASVRRSHAGVKLEIVGEGSMLDAWQARARGLGLEGDCSFRPATSQVADWLRSVDIFVLPSRSEALSNSLMEAMACDCAVIASNVGGNPELVHDGKTGLLFEPGDVAALAQALTRLIDDESLRARLASAALEFVRSRFSIHASAARLGEIYAGLLESGR